MTSLNKRFFAEISKTEEQADGSIILPEAIRPYMGGFDRIAPAK